MSRPRHGSVDIDHQHLLASLFGMGVAIGLLLGVVIWSVMR